MAAKALEPPSSRPDSPAITDSPAVTAINAKMAHLSRTLSLAELNNEAVEALRVGNVPHAFCCIFQAVCRTKPQRLALARRGRRQTASHPTAGVTTHVELPTSTCRYQWVDFVGRTESYRDVRERFQKQQPSGNPLHHRGHGLGAEFLCVRPVRIIIDEDNASSEDCSWVIWYNAATIYHLIADELGESVQRLLAESHRLLLLVTQCIDQNYLPLSKSTHGRSQWHMLLLCVWHNHACLYYERARLDETKKLMKLLHRVIARSNADNFCDVDDDRWPSPKWCKNLVHRMALHAQILCGHRCAGMA